MFNFTGSYILNDLTPSTQYSVYIRAVRLVGVKILEGSQSSNIIVTTKTLSTAGMVYIQLQFLVIEKLAFSTLLCS